MLLQGPGEWKLKIAKGPSHDDYACVTAPGPAVLEIRQNGVLIDRVYLSAGGTHTWWASNPLLRGPSVGDEIHIIISGGPAALRLELPLEPAE